MEAEMCLLKLSTYDALLALEDSEIDWNLKQYGISSRNLGRCPSPPTFLTTTESKEVINRRNQKKKKKKKKEEKKRSMRPHTSWKQETTSSKNNGRTGNIKVAWIPSSLNKMVKSPGFPLRTSNALSTVVLPLQNSLKERGSHNRNLINSVARHRHERNNYDLRAKSRRSILDAAMKSRIRYSLDNKIVPPIMTRGQQGAAFVFRKSNRPKSVYRPRPRGFDWSTK